MKERILHVLFVLVLLVIQSCAKSNLVPDSNEQEITMRCPVTKAAYPTDGIFGVYAHHIPAASGSNRIDSWSSDVVTTYLQNVAFKYNGEEASGWKDGSHYPYYWPLSGSMVFTCYSPYESDSNGTISNIVYNDNLTSGRKENPNLAITFTQKTDPAEMVDLLYFSTMSQSVDKSQGRVPVTFSRALSKLAFYFKDIEGYYRINNIRLCNCINQGVFYAAVESSGWYPNMTVLTDYTLLDTAVGLTSELSSFDIPQLYLLPQPMNGVYNTLGTSTGKNVMLSFDLLDKEDDNFVYTMVLNLNNPDNSNLPAKWEKGVSYEYYISITADPIEFDTPSVSVMVVDTPQTI